MGTKLWVLLTVCCTVDQAGLEQARSVVSGIYRHAGIELEWGNDLTGATANRTLTIVLTTRKKAPAGLRVDATGVAPTPGDGSRGTVAYVFIDAVTEFANEHRVPLVTGAWWGDRPRAWPPAAAAKCASAGRDHAR